MGSEENERLRVKDRRDDFPVFIHSELDDYGLTPIEFRVYSRLARRAGQYGKHSESVPNMAKEFDVSVRTIQRSLKLLVACALVARHIRPGKTDEYSLNPRSTWRNRMELRATRMEIIRPSGDTTEGGPGGDTRAGGDMREGGEVTPEMGVVMTPETDEGYPTEGTPSEGKPKRKKEDLSPPFSSQRFLSTLSDFEQHRTEIRKPLRPTGRKLLYKNLSRMGEDNAIDAMNKSIANGWQGVFEPNGNENNGSYRQNSKQQAHSGSDFQFKPKSIVR